MPVLRHLVVCLCCLWPLAAAASPDRIALVIGMSEYREITSLKNTANDARALSETLEGIGFDVNLLIDAPLGEVTSALAEFAFRAEAADLALVYYAGHGVSAQGETFLIPVDARITAIQDLTVQTVTLDDLLAAVDSARKMRIVILDSCRNNPFPGLIDLRDPEIAGGTGSGGGLAAPDPDRGTLIAFAAREHQVAFDGQGANSPFNTALRDNLTKPGTEIGLVFRLVRDDVLAATGNRQEPNTYGSLSGVPFYLVGTPDQEQQVATTDPTEAWSRLNPDQAIQLAALADGGDTRSMFGLAMMQLAPDTPRYDPQSAAGLLRRSADAGDPAAMFQLARLHEKGIGVPEDLGLALDLYQKAAEAEFPDAVNELGFFYYQGALGLPIDQAKALELFRRAADLKQPEAMFNVASFIDDGLIPGTAPEDAAAYLYQSLRSGSELALDALLEQSSSFKPETRRALQARLAGNGFYDGPLDGDFGPGTQRSIRAAYGLLEAGD